MTAKRRRRRKKQFGHIWNVRKFQFPPKLFTLYFRFVTITIRFKLSPDFWIFLDVATRAKKQFHHKQSVCTNLHSIFQSNFAKNIFYGMLHCSISWHRKLYRSSFLSRSSFSLNETELIQIYFTNEWIWTTNTKTKTEQKN